MALGIRQIILAAIAVVVMVIMGTIASDVINQANATTVALRCLVPYICPDTAYAAGQYIIYFEGNKALGTSGTFKWMFLDIGEYDKLKCELIFKDSSGAETNMDCGQADYVDNFYVMDFTFPDLAEYTVTLIAKDPDKTPLEQRSVVLDFKGDYDRFTYEDFVRLNKYHLPDLLSPGSMSNKRFISGYHIQKGYMVVGFNKEPIVETCRIHNPVPLPEECQDVTCLCLCERLDLCETREKRLCYGYPSVKYFFSVDKSDINLHMGGEVQYPTARHVNYLALYGYCAATFWGTRDLTIQMIRHRSDQIFINITGI